MPHPGSKETSALRRGGLANMDKECGKFLPRRNRILPQAASSGAWQNALPGFFSVVRDGLHGVSRAQATNPTVAQSDSACKA